MKVVQLKKYMTENDTMIVVKYNMGCDMNFDMNMYLYHETIIL